MNFTIKPLNADTWNYFEKLVEKHNGVWGGCWCTSFHPKLPKKEPSAEKTKVYKKKLVEEGKSKAALVFDGDSRFAWCQFGSPRTTKNLPQKGS